MMALPSYAGKMSGTPNWLLAAVVAVTLPACSSPSAKESHASSTSTAVVTSPTSVPPPSPAEIGPSMTFTPSARNGTFAEDLAAAGIPTSAGMTLEMWTGVSFQLATKMGKSDAEVIALLPGDVRGNGIILSPDQAAAVWDSAKRNICPKYK